MRRVLVVVVFLLFSAIACADDAPGLSIGDWWVYVESGGRGTAVVWSYTVARIESATVEIATTDIRDGVEQQQPPLTVERATLASPEGLYLLAAGKVGSTDIQMKLEDPVADTLTLGTTPFACTRRTLTVSLGRRAARATLWTSPDVKTGPRLVKLEIARGERTSTVTLAGYGTREGVTWGVRGSEAARERR